MPDVTLTVNGTTYGGWKTATVRRGIEQVAGSFELTVSDRWSGQDERWPIRKGDACTLKESGDVLITGYVDDAIPFFDSKQHGITVTGRDKTGDLVDCSAIVKTGQWKDRTLLQVATDICKPFGIPVTDEAGADTPFKTAALQEGETAWEALERAGRMRGVLLVSDGKGGLVITRAGTGRINTPLVQGKNIKVGRGAFSMRDRHSVYTCKGQAVGFDTSSPEQNASPVGEATDPAVTRYRPLVILAESTSDAAGLKNRAMWEAAVRKGRSARPVFTVQGWRHADGLWSPNLLVPVKCPYLDLDQEMLVVSVAHTIGRGSYCELELGLPEGFELAALSEPEDDSVWA